MGRKGFWWEAAKAGLCLAAVAGVVAWGYMYAAWMTTAETVGRNSQRLELIERTRDRFYRSEFDAWLDECRKAGFDLPDAPRTGGQK